MATAEPADLATASVEREDGQWVVYLTVLFPDGVVRRRIGQHRTEHLARIAATWIERASNRDVLTPGNQRPPTEGPATT
ncbi:MAG: AP2 domain-containing protein [Actinomycetota bacterium]|uniref:AP2 domain-containing protein n=1 Tax=Euzebya rosea TaxID=2052804 RepID=UPI000D3E44E3|nr:AP2 domain-containing protein [Euzebya rosea]